LGLRILPSETMNRHGSEQAMGRCPVQAGCGADFRKRLWRAVQTRAQRHDLVEHADVAGRRRPCNSWLGHGLTISQCKTADVYSSPDSVDGMSDWNTQVIAEFRANKGKVAQFGDAPLVILHTIGAKSGALREIPLVALVDADGMFVFASRGGSPNNPDWLHNLRGNSKIVVEHGNESFQARLTELPEAERFAKLGAQAALMPTFGDYIAAAAPRLIPVFRIDRI
jgi:deazaflavin-dependent oxidoreductase (nitroreductase family)